MLATHVFELAFMKTLRAFFFQKESTNSPWFASNGHFLKCRKWAAKKQDDSENWYRGQTFNLEVFLGLSVLVRARASRLMKKSALPRRCRSCVLSYTNWHAPHASSSNFFFFRSSMPPAFAINPVLRPVLVIRRTEIAARGGSRVWGDTPVLCS